MKRCPQCEFIYEDEQDFCDMDGRGLEPVPAVASGPLSLAALPTRTAAARLHRRLIVRLISGVVLTAILISGYYVQTSQTATGHAGDAGALPAAAAGSQAETAPPPETPPPSPVRPTNTKVRPPAEAPQKKSGGAARIGGTAAKPPASAAGGREARTRGPESLDDRKESKKGSKLGAALKKAGRVLKKPFGF